MKALRSLVLPKNCQYLLNGGPQLMRPTSRSNPFRAAFVESANSSPWQATALKVDSRNVGLKLSISQKLTLLRVLFWMSTTSEKKIG